MSLRSFLGNCNDYLLNSDTDESRFAIKYLAERGYNKDSISNFNIGFCPSGFEIPDEIRYYGEGSDSNIRDWKYNLLGRVILPVLDEFGDPISAATKKPGPEKNPWWNLPFCKSNSLFLINKAKSHMYLKNKVYVVEGYCDAMTLYKNGIKNVVAVMGTSMTVRKIALISRYCNNICMCFDVDKNNSGQKASASSILKIKSYSFCESISIIDDIPVGEDPDSYVKEYGVKNYLSKEREVVNSDLEAFRKRMNNVR
jgi:DNA primase